MTVALLLFYLASHFVGFAGFGILAFVLIATKRPEYRHYFLFLATIFAFVLAKDCWFFAASFLGAADWADSSAYVLSMSALSWLLLASYAFFMRAVYPTLGGAAAALLFAYSFLPALVFAAAAVLALAAPGLAGARAALAQANDAVLIAALPLSAAFFVVSRRKAINEIAARIARITALVNLALALPAALQFWANYHSGLPGRPYCLENVLYLAVQLTNIFYLARVTLLGSPEPGFAVYSFSERERQIIGLIRRGLANKQIAAELGIAEITVRNAIYRLFKQTKVRNRVELLQKLNLID